MLPGDWLTDAEELLVSLLAQRKKSSPVGFVLGVQQRWQHCSAVVCGREATESKSLSRTVLEGLLGYEMITQSKWTDQIYFHETGQAVTFPFFVHSEDEVVSIYKCWVILKFCQHCCSVCL